MKKCVGYVHLHVYFYSDDIFDEPKLYKQPTGTLLEPKKSSKVVLNCFRHFRNSVLN